MSHLKKRGNKWYLYYYLNGKQVGQSLYTADAAVAKQKQKDLDAQLRLKLHPQASASPAPRGVVTLSVLLAQYKSSSGRRPKTLEALSIAVKHFIAVAGDKSIYRYTAEDYDMLLSFFHDKQLSINTISIYTRALSALWHFAVKKKLASSNIISPTRGDNKDVLIIPDNDIETITSAAGADLSLLIRFLYATGLRIGEALSLRPSDINTKDNTIIIRNQKANRRDIIPIIADTCALLPRLNLSRVLVFNGITYNAVRIKWYRLIGRLLRDGKISTRYTLHALRRSCGSRLANAGVTPVFLQKYMRHRNFNTTMKYYIKSDLNQMTDEINRLLNK